jgi:ATP-dependent DNA helicase RecQ
MEHIRNGEAKLLYVAPETLLTPRAFALLDELNVALLVIDEAHCISEWGHDFRPEYRQLTEVRRRYPQAVCMALTATATPRVRTDISQSLGFAQANAFIASFNRTNLYIEVMAKRDAVRQTELFLERFKDQSGIIYCFSRKQVDELAAHLAGRGLAVRPYHAGLEDDVRRRNQEAFIRDDVQIMVATIAFGMGINKPNVRFVIHFDLPKSIEGYYQEIGRAGRDGLPAQCLLLYSYSDVAKLNYFVNQKEGQERQVAKQHLDAIVRYAEDERTCRRKPLLGYFGEAYAEAKCDNCDNCNAAPPELEDITIPAQKFLSCVKRTGERFGAKHVVDVLRGSQNEKVLSNGHQELSTYGIGLELTEKQWMHLARQLTQMGYLRQDGEFRTLSLTPLAVDALKKRSVIMGQLQAADRVRAAKTPRGELEYETALFELLRQKRKALADQEGVPPYVIFSDKTLVEMAAYLPQSDESLLTISGVGQVKLHEYGDKFLAVIKAYCAKHKLAEKKKYNPRDKSDAGRRYMVVSEAYNAGASMQTLRAQYNVTLETILEHLSRYISAGHTLRADDGELRALCQLPETEEPAVRAAFAKHGPQALKPIFDELQGRVSYEQLRVIRLLLASSPHLKKSGRVE